jgi:hypothetical protein
MNRNGIVFTKNVCSGCVFIWMRSSCRKDSIHEGELLDVVVAPTASAGGAKSEGDSKDTKNKEAAALAKKYDISEREATLVLQQSAKSSVEQVLWTDSVMRPMPSWKTTATTIQA